MRSNPTESESSAFYSWFKNAPENKFQLSEAPQLQSITQHYLIKFTVASTTQSRSIEKDWTPYDTTISIQQTSDKVYNNDDLWTINVPVPELFEDAEVFKVLDGTYSKKECFHCKGRKSVDCSSCHARGKIICIACNSNGKTTCKKCNGLSVSICKKCDGKGFRNGQKCMYCNTLGKTRCDSCEGGYLPCNICARSGQVLCSTCLGHRDVECDPCMGEGQLMFFSKVVVRNKVHIDTFEYGDNDLTHEVRWHLLELEDKLSPTFEPGISKDTIEYLKTLVPEYEADIFLRKLNHFIIKHSEKIDNLLSENSRIIKGEHSKFEQKEFISYYFLVSGEEYRVTFLTDSNIYILHSNPWDKQVDKIKEQIAEFIQIGNHQTALELIDDAILSGANNKQTRALRKEIVKKALTKDLKTKLLPYTCLSILITSQSESEMLIASLFIGGVILCIWLFFRQGERESLPTQKQNTNLE